MNISPKVTILRSIRADRGDIVRLCGEAVDNSLDANAAVVSIDENTESIIFQDDGIGIALNRFPALFSLGEHGEMSSTRLGRFGIGIKSQAINVADILDVKSVSVDGCYRARVNWRELLRGGEWEIDDPVRLPVAVGAQTGTTIALSHLRRLRPFTREKIIDELSQRFFPAISDGRRIVLNGTLVPLLVNPRMTDQIEKELVLSGGRGAVVRAGVLAETSKLNRVHVAFGHRVIMPGSTIGCGTHVGLSNMFARVQLLGTNWHLGQYKDQLTDEDERDELEEALEAVLEPILSKCGSVSMTARIAAISALVNEQLPEAISAARPHKQKKKSQTGTKRKHRQGEVDATKSDPASGPAKTKRPKKDELLITFEGNDAEHGVGWYESGRPSRVNLSQDNDHIARLIQQRDEKLIASALVIIALQIFEHGRSEGRLNVDRPFGCRVADHLRAARGDLVREKSA